MAYDLHHLKCNHCGNDLALKKEIKFFNCQHCGSFLILKKREDDFYTEVLEKNGEHDVQQQSIPHEAEDLELEAETQVLDQPISFFKRSWFWISLIYFFLAYLLIFHPPNIWLGPNPSSLDSIYYLAPAFCIGLGIFQLIRRR